jgi:hypothetical protein
MNFIKKYKKEQKLIQLYLKGKITKEELEKKGVKIRMPI